MLYFIFLNVELNIRKAVSLFFFKPLKALRSYLSLTLRFCYAPFKATIRYENAHLAMAKLHFSRLYWPQNGL